jgi:hypothetical protein
VDRLHAQRMDSVGFVDIVIVDWLITPHDVVGFQNILHLST